MINLIILKMNKLLFSKSKPIFIILISLAVYYRGVNYLKTQVYAAGSSTFNQTINAGTLSVDIVDTTNSYSSVGSPSIDMSTVTFSFNSQNSTGTFGTSTEAIYVQNPDAADDGWLVTLGASANTATWNSAGTPFDFNDANGATDGADTDSYGGQMTVDPSGGTIATGSQGAATTNITAGSSNSFVEGTVDSISLMTAASGSADIGDWYMTGVAITQAIPASQPAANDYNIVMTLSITAS